MRLALGTLACALVASGGGGDRSTIPSPHAQSVYEWVKHKSASRETQAPITCAIDVSREPRDVYREPGFLPPRATAEACGLPLSRPFLLARYGLALRVRPGSRAVAVPGGAAVVVVVEGCRAIGADALPWADNLTVARAEREEGWCAPAALDLVARVRGAGGVVAASVAPSGGGACAWDVRFALPRDWPAAAPAHLEVLNEWLRASAEPATPLEAASAFRPRLAWVAASPRDEILWQFWAERPRGARPLGALVRGAPFMPCAERCMLTERCRFWTQEGWTPGHHGCKMYVNVSATARGRG